jgi:hypothetical protein
MLQLRPIAHQVLVKGPSGFLILPGDDFFNDLPALSAYIDFHYAVPFVGIR